MAQAPRPDRRLKPRLILPVALLVAAAVLVTTHRDQARAVWGSLTSVPVPVLAGALALVLCQLGFQAVRLWAILPRDVALTPGRVAYAFTLGEWVNIFAPARAGDALKVVLLNRAAAAETVSVAKATGAVLADKIVDAGSLVLLCATAGLIRVPGPAIPAAAAGVLTLLWLGVRFARPAWRERLTGLRRELSRGFAALKDPVKLVASTSCSVAAWMAEALALGVLCRGLGAPVPFPLIVLALGALNVGISVPLGAANMGVYEAALALGLRHAGAPLASAVAIAALHHLLELLGTNLGAAAFWLGAPSGNEWRIWSWRRHTLS